MTFLLPLLTSLSKLFCHGIMNNTILDKTIVSDLDENIGSSFSNISTYRLDKMESMLSYIDTDVVLLSIWPKIQKKAAKIDAT